MFSLQSILNRWNSLHLIFLLSLPTNIVQSFNTSPYLSRQILRVPIGCSRFVSSIVAGKKQIRGLSLSTSSSHEQQEQQQLSQRLQIEDRFGRWRFLQALLDEETTASATNQVLHYTLVEYLRNADKGWDGVETGSPELTPKRRFALQTLLGYVQHNAIPILRDDEDDEHRTTECATRPTAIETLLQEILPDPTTDEDGVKGNWDTIIELHGREAVRMNEKNGTNAWKVRCLIARVLLYHDFLTMGIV